TQAELAAKIPGVDRTRISRWESGENLPDPVYREKLSSLLSLPEGFFDEIPNSSNNPDRASRILAIQSALLNMTEEQFQNLEESIEHILNPIELEDEEDSKSSKVK